MIEFNDRIYDKQGIKGLLLQLARHIVLLIIAVLLLAVPCYLFFLVILELE